MDKFLEMGFETSTLDQIDSNNVINKEELKEEENIARTHHNQGLL